MLLKLKAKEKASFQLLDVKSHELLSQLDIQPPSFDVHGLSEQNGIEPTGHDLLNLLASLQPQTALLLFVPTSADAVVTNHRLARVSLQRQLELWQYFLLSPLVRQGQSLHVVDPDHGQEVTEHGRNCVVDAFDDPGEGNLMHEPLFQ